MSAARRSLLLALCTLLACVGAPAVGSQPGVSADFWPHWGDGRAELAGYRLRTPRYGQMRDGELVLVAVTEEFTQATRVKSDGGHGDEFPVLKLNQMRSFLTGMYEYNVMTSAFLPLDGHLPVGQATKVSMSMQEWCGHAWEQWVVQPGAVERSSHSYFDGEADVDEQLPLPEGGLFEDALPLTVRGLAGVLVGPGERVERPILESAQTWRFRHRDPRWSRATIERSRDSEVVESVLGPIRAHTVTVAIEGGVTTRYLVEDAAPHRLLGWTSSNGEEAVLSGLTREAYWSRSGVGNEGLRRQLGLREPGQP